MSNSRITLWVLVSIVVVLAAGAGGWFSHASFAGDFRTYDLGDGRKIILLRNLEQVYPVYGKTVKAELDLALAQKKATLDTTAGGKYETAAKQLYQSLDAINADVRTALVSSYSGLILKVSTSKDPSVLAEAFKKWDQTLELVIKQAFKIRAINGQLASAKKNISSGEWEQVFVLGHEAAETNEQLKSLVAAPGSGGAVQQ